MDWFTQLGPIEQALLAGLFTWALTALGSFAVVVARQPSQKLLDAMLGFAAGIMLAASIWSLLLPAIEIASEQSRFAWWPAAVGFLLGGGVLRLIDRFLPHLHPGLPRAKAEGVRTAWDRAVLLVLAITLHNIPEGLAVGVAFGAAAHPELGEHASLAAAMTLALGIGLQNLPEGMAVSMPLRREGVSIGKSFWYGQLSAVVEPVAAVVGAIAVTSSYALLPYALAFAAGAMVFVVVEELIPESQQGGSTDLATLGTLVGFVVMMILDVQLG
jgi:ZIP family zinc transporter